MVVVVQGGEGHKALDAVLFNNEESLFNKLEPLWSGLGVLEEGEACNLLSDLLLGHYGKQRECLVTTYSKPFLAH